MTNPTYFDKETHTYFYKGKQVPSVSHILSSLKLSGDFSKMPEEKRKYYALRGIIVHELIEAYIVGGTPLETLYEEAEAHIAETDVTLVRPEFEPYVDAAVAFIESQLSDEHELHTEEQAITSQFGTTSDLLCDDVIIDFKTGNKYAAHKMQLAAGMDAHNKTGKLFRRGYCVYLNADGSWEIDNEVGIEYVKRWTKVLQIYHDSRISEENKALYAAQEMSDAIKLKENNELAKDMVHALKKKEAWSQKVKEIKSDIVDSHPEMSIKYLQNRSKMGFELKYYPYKEKIVPDIKKLKAKLSKMDKNTKITVNKLLSWLEDGGDCVRMSKSYAKHRVKVHKPKKNKTTKKKQKPKPKPKPKPEPKPEVKPKPKESIVDDDALAIVTATDTHEPAPKAEKESELDVKSAIEKMRPDDVSDEQWDAFMIFAEGEIGRSRFDFEAIHVEQLRDKVAYTHENDLWDDHIKNITNGVLLTDGIV